MNKSFQKIFFTYQPPLTETKKQISIWLLYILNHFMLILLFLEKNLTQQILVLIELRLFLTWERSPCKVLKILREMRTPFYLLSIMTMKNCFGQKVKEHLVINFPFPIRLFLFKLIKNGKNSKKWVNISRILY